MRWLIAVALVACGRDQQPPPPSASVLVPERAPAHTPTPPRPAGLGDLVVTDAAGQPVALSSRMRDVTVLAFWASWCEPCQQEMPLVDRYAASEHDARVAVLAINVDERADHQAALDAIAARKLRLPVLFDPDEKVYAAAFQTEDTQIPALAIISRDGVATEIGFDGDLTEAQHVAHVRDLVHAHMH